MLEKSPKNISQLRFILQQPSTYWKDFGIDDVKLKIANPVSSLNCLYQRTKMKTYFSINA